MEFKHTDITEWGSASKRDDEAVKMMLEHRRPEGVLQKASLRGKEYAWRQADVREAVLAAEQTGLATLGGQTQFRLPDGTCELYWLDFDASSMKTGETWQQFVDRSAQESLSQFEQMCQTVDFVQEGIRAFSILGEKAEAEDIGLYLCFVIYFVSEETYRQL
jgi:hypothetical protein